MASQPDSANFPLLVSRNAARERVRDALRLHVGRGRRYSVKELSNGTGVRGHRWPTISGSSASVGIWRRQRIPTACIQ
jgi:hypothetical protein